MKTSIWLDQMTSPQIKKALTEGYQTVLLAVGSTEQHGPHLPLGTDSLIGDKIMERLGRRLEKTLAAPTIRVGVSEHHMAFTGTITLREEVLEEVIVDYCRSLSRHGFRLIVLIPTHGGNTATVARVPDRLEREGLAAKVVTLPDDSAYISAMVEVGEKHNVTPGEAGGHAGHLETSTMLADYPDIVDMERAACGKVDLGFDAEEKLHTMGMHQLSPVGILGDATRSSAAAGVDYNEHIAAALAEQIRRMQAEFLA
jgi:creatinine amidohydrolase